MLSILLVIYHTFGLAFRTRLNFTQPGAIAIRDLHIVTLAPYAIRQSAIGLYRRQVMAQGRGQGAGRPSTGSTGAIVSIFLGRDSEARELRVKLEVIHSCIDRLIGASVSEPPLVDSTDALSCTIYIYIYVRHPLLRMRGATRKRSRPDRELSQSS